MRYFQGWLNAEAVKYGGRQVSIIHSKYILIMLTRVRCRLD